MIDAKQAVLIAKERAAEMFPRGPFNLEEIEREQYKAHDAWSIMRSLPRARTARFQWRNSPTFAPNTSVS